MDLCEEPDPLVPDVTVVLEHAALDKDGMYVGEFEIENQRISPALSIPGRKTKETFYVDYPDVSVEFKDLNGSGVALANHAPGVHEVTQYAQHPRSFEGPLHGGSVPGRLGQSERHRLPAHSPPLVGAEVRGIQAVSRVSGAGAGDADRIAAVSRLSPRQ